MTRSSPSGIAVGATVVACLAALGAMLLPWLRSGDTRRSAFALARSADALGFIDTPLRRALFVSCYLLPLLTAATWTAAAVGRPGLVAVLGALLGLTSVAAGLVVITGLRPQPGPVAAVSAGSVALVSAGWLGVILKTSATARDRERIEGRGP